jgi:hypothetical protein
MPTTSISTGYRHHEVARAALFDEITTAKYLAGATVSLDHSCGSGPGTHSASTADEQPVTEPVA